MSEPAVCVVEEKGCRALELCGFSREDEVRHLFGLRGPRRVETLAGRFGVGRERVISVRQVHGDSAWIVDEGALEANRAGQTSGDEGLMEGGGYDAMITQHPGWVLSIRTADCLPILIWDKVKSVVGAVHAGWRGSLGAIASKTVQLMKSRFGSNLRDLQVGIGPAIGSCCYEIGETVLGPLRERIDFWREVVRENGSGKGLLDLVGLNVRQLIHAGVSADRIMAPGVCTVCHPEHFKSYRRDGDADGGMISAIMIRDP